MKTSAEIDLALTMIRPHMTVSLGGGRHMQALATALAEQGVDVNVCSPSAATLATCRSLGMRVVGLPDTVDLAFDGADSVDTQFQALKSNGGMHVLEKLYAQSSRDYVLVVPAARVTSTLAATVPLTLDVISSAVNVTLAAAHVGGLQATVRRSSTFQRPARSPIGNALVDVYASDWRDISAIDARLSGLNGVVGTSYFENLVTGVITNDADGQARLIRKENNNDNI